MPRPRSLQTMTDVHLSLPERDLNEARLYLLLNPEGGIKRNELSKLFATLLRQWLDERARKDAQIIKD